MKIYHSQGHSYLVCPNLIKLDKRHSEHWSKHPPCRHGLPCLMDHEHEKPLAHGEGHMTNDYHWFPGCRPHNPNEHPICQCGEKLIHTDLDDLYDPKHTIEI